MTGLKLNLSEEEKREVEKTMSLFLLHSWNDYFRFAIRLCLLERKRFISFALAYKRPRGRKTESIKLYPSREERELINSLSKSIKVPKSHLYFLILTFPARLRVES